MITALILAAGQSKRMGQPKMLLPWGNTSVLGRVIETIQAAGVEDILVVTGGTRMEVEAIVQKYAVRSVHNSDYTSGEMLSSLQVGLRLLSQAGTENPSSPDGGKKAGREAALVVLGDQPQIEERSVRAVVDRFVERSSSLVVPSFQMRRGHPWLAARPLWEKILALRPPQSPRDFLNAHARTIDYVNVDTPSILADLDTPDDYLKSRP